MFSEQRIGDGIAALRRFIAMHDAAAAAGELPGVDWAQFRLGQLLTLAGDARAADAAFDVALRITDDPNMPAAVRRFRRGG